MIVNNIEQLRKKCTEIKDFDKDYLTNIRDKLIKELRGFDMGYAISAPQIGYSERIILIDINNPNITTGVFGNYPKPIFLINPTITKKSKKN